MGCFGLDLMVFVVCMVFGLVLTVLGFRSKWLGMFGLLFGVVLFVDLFLNGLSTVAGVSGESAVTSGLGVDVVIWIPLILIFVNAVSGVANFRG